MSDHSDQFQFLSACCAAYFGSESARMALRNERIDWEQVFELSLAHRVTPILSHVLQKDPNLCPTATLREKAQRYARANARRALALSAELLAIINLLEAQRIPTLPWKGPVLAQQVYGQVGLRDYLDLDVLVPKARWMEAFSILENRGYILARENADEVARGLSNPDRYCQLLYHPYTKVGVELHWALTSESFRLPLDYRTFWAKRRSVDFFGRKIDGIKPEAELLSLCCHGNRHYWKKLSWICDLAAFLKHHKELNWWAVMQEAQTLRCERILAISLHVVRLTLQQEVPVIVRARIDRDKTAKRFAHQIYARLAQNGGELNKAQEERVSLWRLWYSTRSRERTTDGLSYLGKLLRSYFGPNSRDRAMINLPRHLTSLYLVIRPARLLGSEIRRVWKTGTSTINSGAIPGRETGRKSSPPRSTAVCGK